MPRRKRVSGKESRNDFNKQNKNGENETYKI